MSATALENAIEETGVTPVDIQKARTRISTCIHKTPVLTSKLADKWLSDSEYPTRFYFKVEALQKTGSFKFRGAYNAVSALEEAGDQHPIVAHSSGNHGQALAHAAALFNRDAWLVVPQGAPRAKVDALLDYGATIVRCENNLKDRVRVAEKVRIDIDGVLVHSYLNKDVVCGQGTIGLELMEQLQDIDAIVVPIGGGGLISGISIAVKSQHPSVRIIGAEPEKASAAARSMAEGERVQIDGVVETVADGVKTSVGLLGWQVISRLVDEVITVSEVQIIEATKFIWQRMKIVIEPTSGVGVAAARTVRFRKLKFKNVAIILCGGNIDVDKLPWNK